MKARIIRALIRCRSLVLSVFLTYVLSSTVGAVMVHSGSSFALAKRDKVVGVALETDTALNYQSGHPGAAVLLDFAGNVLFAAVPQMVAGLGVVLPYVSVAYQGWVGGIVSVDSAHVSRLRSFKGAAYYLTVLLLQFIPFSLSIGAGIRFGVDLWAHNGHIGWHVLQYRIPRQSLLDLGYVCCVALPLFLLASGFEFLSPWNV